MLWCLNPADHNPRIITKGDQGFSKRGDFKDIKSTVKIGDIHKIGKRNFINGSVFGYENNEKYSIYVSNQYFEEKHVFKLINDRRERKKHYILIKDFSAFKYDH